MKHSPWMMVACVAVIATGIALAVAGFASAFLLFVVACVLMMGGMVWMMVRGPGA